MRFFVVSLLCFLPSVSLAAVTIHEIAWMGSVDSANHEWIELYNNSNVAVDVTGWELSDGMKLTIPLSGSITADSYVVLERTSDESAAGTAFLIYTGSLVNTGATLTLKRADGSLEDQVSGGENWENIGGDNETKETAQYTTSGWITGKATPGKKNTNVISVKETESEQTSSNSNGILAKSIPAGEPVRLILPDVTLRLEVSAQSVGYVNQTINFSVKASDVGKTLADSLKYEWNFGDGVTASGKEPSHAYQYPGTYVVTVYGSYKRQEQVARYEITILPVSISLTRNAEGALQINNDSPYEIDISEYVLNGGKEFVFPARSVLLPNQTITIPLTKIGYGEVSVFDAMGKTVIKENVGKKDVEKKTTQNVTASYSALPRVLGESTDGTVATTTISMMEATSAPKEIISTTDGESSGLPSDSLPYVGLLGIIAVGTLGILAKPERRTDGLNTLDDKTIPD